MERRDGSSANTPGADAPGRASLLGRIAVPPLLARGSTVTSLRAISPSKLVYQDIEDLRPFVDELAK